MNHLCFVEFQTSECLFSFAEPFEGIESSMNQAVFSGLLIRKNIKTSGFPVFAGMTSVNGR